MPRAHAVTSQDADQPKTKRQKLTNSQLERKRELDREAQRTIRERTKNHIAHLEALVHQLQGDQGGQVQRLVAQLNESRAEVNRLRDALANITKISTSVLTTNQASLDASLEAHIKQETSPCPPPETKARRKRSAKSQSISQFNDESEAENEPESFTSAGISTTEEPRSSILSTPTTYCVPDNMYHSASYLSDNTPSKLAPDEHDLVEEPDSVQDDSPSMHIDANQLSVAQMAASIVANRKLEGRYWYLAGVLLTEILKKQHQGGFINYANDEDIAIRAVFEGWSSVTEKYPLDRGWQWLRECDETIYFRHFGPAERLMNLRNCRYQFLHQCYPDAGWNKNLPSFYAVRHPSQHELGFDPLVEHFPWPGFRKQLLFSPRKFATNKFMESLRRHLCFIWNNEPQALYQRDALTGRYLYSDLFTKHIWDVKCYAARPIFFENFPELGGDIPWSRMEEPSPLSIISHRFSIGSNSTSSTNRASPIVDEEIHEEGYDRSAPLSLSHPYYPFWQSETCSPVVPGFVRELSAGDIAPQ